MRTINRIRIMADYTHLPTRDKIMYNIEVNFYR